MADVIVSLVHDALGIGADDAEEQSWQDRALCAQTDPEAFFPEKGGSTREAAAPVPSRTTSSPRTRGSAPTQTGPSAFLAVVPAHVCHPETRVFCGAKELTLSGVENPYDVSAAPMRDGVHSRWQSVLIGDLTLTA